MASRPRRPSIYSELPSLAQLLFGSLSVDYLTTSLRGAMLMSQYGNVVSFLRFFLPAAAETGMLYQLA